jgi:hypothetical protein
VFQLGTEVSDDRERVVILDSNLTLELLVSSIAWLEVLIELGRVLVLLLL